MCLNLITKTFNPPDPKIRKGWKYVKQNEDGSFSALYQGIEYSTAWQEKESTNYTITTTSNLEKMRDVYPTGFHVFLSREEARKAKRLLLKQYAGTFARETEEGSLKLVKVEVKDVTTEGTDASSSSRDYLDANIKTMVANQMRIVAVVKD